MPCVRRAVSVIACVLRSGGAYRPEHVQRLASQARTFAPGEAIVCLSDVPVPGVSTVPLSGRWPGWWSKLELFASGMFPAGARILYLDLDSTIIGPLDDMLRRREAFVMLADFYRRPPIQAKRGLGSGLMLWTAGEQDRLYTEFAADAGGIMARWRAGGDQRFLETMLGTTAVGGLDFKGLSFWEDILPGQAVSYKCNCRPFVPAGARVICYHGQPKPWDVPAPDLAPEAVCRS